VRIVIKILGSNLWSGHIYLTAFQVVYTTDVYIYIFFWIPYRPRMLINVLWHPLDANQYGGPSWRTGSIFSCCNGLWDCLPTKPITTKHQSVFWSVSQSRRMSAIYVGIGRWISLAAASADPVVYTVMPWCNLEPVK